MNRNLLYKFIFVQSLTLGRMPLIFIFLIITIIAAKPEGGPMSPLWFSLAFAAMIMSAVTDLFDGYYARKFNVVTRLGAYADPMTDKVFYLTTFPTLVFLAVVDGQHGHATLLLCLAILFLLRDQWVSFLRSIGALHNVDAKANWSGKARTMISFPAICVIYYYLMAPREWWLLVHPVVVYSFEVVSVVINVISIFVYTRNYWPCLKLEMALPDRSNDDENGE